MSIVTLDGKNLTIELVSRIAHDHSVKVEIDSNTRQKLVEARQLVFDLVDEGVQIYGFNTGVGWNKDQDIFEEYFQEYNTQMVLSHCVCAGEVLNDIEVRAVMLCRLGGFLSGCTGASLDVIDAYVDFINKGISPLIPRSGSVGVGDITNIPHIGLAMLGRGEVYYNGEVMLAKDAIYKSGLKIVDLGPKDGLAIISSNAFGAGLAALMLKEAKDLLKISSLLLATSFDGYNCSNLEIDMLLTNQGNYGTYNYATDVKKHLANRELLSSSSKTNLPFAFKNGLSVNAAAIDALNNLEELLTIQLNSSDDNPCLLLEERRIISCCNFETINWVLALEELGQLLNHVAKLSCYRSIELEAEANVLESVEMMNSKLYNEIRFLSNPGSLDFIAVAGDIEDRGNNTQYVATKTTKIVRNLFNIMENELNIACKLISLSDNTLGDNVKQVYNLYTKKIKDDSSSFLKSKALLDIMSN
ncbi:MAG: aromatic amino acid lyase [Bacilli bacterium]